MEKDSINLQSNISLIKNLEPLYDYGKIYKGPDHYLSYTPNNIQEAVDFMKYSASKQYNLRFRGSGHTFNGVTLPVDDEVIVFTTKIDHYRLEEDNTLTAGAGAILWDVRDLARDFGYDLLVYNGGWAGPSVGGFINAGGFGKGNLSLFNGGLWESINSITLIDAQGDLKVINRDDELFPWLFGSYGQLGFIVAANFKLKKINPGLLFSNQLLSKKTPPNREGRIPKRQVDDPNDNKLSPEKIDSKILFWFSLLIAPEDDQRVWKDLQKWADDNEDIIEPEGGWHGPVKNGKPIGYHYTIKYKNFHPPLIYHKPEDFLVVGIMSSLYVNKQENIDRILAVENEFIELALHGGYRLYLQAENFGKNIDFRQYYGEDIYSQFLKFKNKLDPNHRINRNVFFKSYPLN